MDDRSRRIVSGIQAIRTRFASQTDCSRLDSIFSPNHRPGGQGSIFHFASSPPIRAADRVISRTGTDARSCSSSRFLPRVFFRSFCSGSDECRPWLGNWRRMYLSGSRTMNFGGSVVGRSNGVTNIGNSLKVRLYSSEKFNLGKSEGAIGRSLASKPLEAFSSFASRYREAVGLQMEAFWKRNYLVLVGVSGVFLCIGLWRLMFGVASTFVGLSEGMAKYGFLALASAIVSFAGLYLRARFTLNPDRIYRMAMRKLNTSAGILEVMGAPLSGTDVRAYIMSGGGVRLKNFRLRFGGKRCFLIFPIKGSERRGLVSVEAKKKNGQYDIKLLAVDIPMAAGTDQRIFLIGDEVEYRVGGGLISELRDPIVMAMAAEKEFEDQDLREEEEDERREMEEEERRRQDEMMKSKNTDS
ncbi:uncharacterized protein LOC144714304 [Wolffia australiana]